MYIIFNNGDWSLLVYINVTTDQLLNVFCLFEIHRDFFPFPKNYIYCMNTEDKGFCHLKKGLCIKDVRNAHGHTLSCQDYSSSCSAALHLLQGRGWEVFCTRVYSLALPSGEEYLAVQESWDHEQLCNFPPLRFSQQGLSLIPANPLQLSWCMPHWGSWSCMYLTSWLACCGERLLRMLAFIDHVKSSRRYTQIQSSSPQLLPWLN